ncbi:MAG: hypothetical protein FWD61_10775 [Phycisphaerales bacterium]|nr:hypothetical protein [Phycisphaerales bacterium]
MTKTTRLLVGAALIVSPTLISLAQLNVSPPTSTATTIPAATQPTTVPSARSVLEGLINDPVSAPAAQPVSPAINPDPTLTPAISANAPKPPVTTRRIEKDALQGIGRLVKDDKNNAWIFVFDSDGPSMTDPPIGLLPNRILEAMEQINAKSPRGAKFKIAGEITEYKGKNFLLLRNVYEIRDLNQGIGG